MALIPPSSPTTGVDAVPDILCETCRSICKDSFIIQTYTSHGIDKNEASLEDVCVAAGKAREYFKWCTVKEFRAACQLGCHLCLMLRHRDMNQHYDLLVETEDEEEKSGKTSTLLKIACNESYDGSVEVTMCTVAEKEKELRPGFPFATYRVPMEPRGDHQLLFS